MQYFCNSSAAMPAIGLLKTLRGNVRCEVHIQSCAIRRPILHRPPDIAVVDAAAAAATAACLSCISHDRWRAGRTATRAGRSTMTDGLKKKIAGLLISSV